MSSRKTSRVRWIAVAAVIAAIMRITSLTAMAEDRVFVRASIEPREDIVVGQRVLYRLDVLGQDGWASLPQLPPIELSGALVYSPRSQSVRLSETIEGESYSGQRYEMWIYPQRAGRIEIPSVVVNASIRTFGVNSEANTKQLQTKSIEFEVGMPRGVTDGTNLVCTTQFNARQSWHPEQLAAQVGDGIERVVTRTIVDVPGMVLTPLRRTELPGIRVYPKQPSIDDSINRGELTGRRTESVTYVFEQPGETELPELVFTWWDIDSKQLREERLPGLTLSVTPNPNTAQAATDVVTTESESRTTVPGILVVVAVVALLCGLCVRHRRSILAKWRQWLASYRASEWSKFRRFVRAASANDPRATLRMLMRWLDYIETGEQPAQLVAFLDRYGDLESRQAAEELVLAAQAPTGIPWDGRRLITEVDRARKRYRSSHRPATAKETMLPDMNPHMHRR